MGAAKDVEMAPYYVDGKYIGDYPKAFVEWATAKAEKERLKKEAEIPNDAEHRMPYWSKMYARCVFTMVTALIRKDWEPIKDFLRTAKTIEECEAEKNGRIQGSDQ